MIECQGICKSFDGRLCMDHATTVFRDGLTNLIIGKSGSGKTVLLKSLVGLYEVDEGRILYDGRDVTAMTGQARLDIRREVGMIFQGSALFDYMTVEENVRFPLDMFTDKPLRDRRLRAQECLRRVDMPATADNLYPAQISGGMQKRVAIARAIVQGPRYLFCDEPNSGLDPVTAGIIDQLISGITHESGITTIINTHDMNSVFSIGEHVCFIEAGVMHWQGTKDNILASDSPELHAFMQSAVRLAQVHGLGGQGTRNKEQGTRNIQ